MAFVLQNRRFKMFTPLNFQIWAMAFGGGGQNYYNACDRVLREMSQIKICNQLIKYTDADLKNNTHFWSNHKDFIENNKRGYGYWIWKPYLILNTLMRMPLNSVLIYVDGGCEVVNRPDSYTKLRDIVNRCDDILYTSSGLSEASYTKMDLFEYMNIESYDQVQYQAGVLFIKNNTTMQHFITEWYNIACNYHLLDDSPSLLPNHANFIDNRHDQSIFSLLLRKHNMNVENKTMRDIRPIRISWKRW